MHLLQPKLNSQKTNLHKTFCLGYFRHPRVGRQIPGWKIRPSAILSGWVICSQIIEYSGFGIGIELPQPLGFLHPLNHLEPSFPIAPLHYDKICRMTGSAV